jgi:hypothetical protein
MLRRIVIVGFAAALAGPILTVTPAEAAVLFNCGTVTGTVTLNPGLTNVPAHQDDVSGASDNFSCDNGDGGSFAFGSGAGLSTVSSVASFNGDVACSMTAPNNTVLMTGLTDPSVGFLWDADGGATSSGITKIKAAGSSDEVKLVLVITAGRYAPPIDKKTKMKGTFAFAPNNGSCSGIDPTTQITLGGSVIVQQVAA